MPFYSIDESVFRERAPGFKAAFAHSGHITVAHWITEAGAVLPQHSHAHEQIVNVVEGKFELQIGDESVVLGRDTVAVIPPDVVHYGRALTACRIIDVFYPIREDFK